MQYKEIDIMTVVNNPDNRKTEKEQGIFSVAELQKSIELYGQLQPIIVKPLRSGEYKVLAGERRVVALKLCQHETVKAIILDDDDLQDEDAIRRIENSCRRQLHPLDEAVEIAGSVEKDGIAITSVTFGVSTSYCRKRMQLLQLIPELKEKFLAGEIKLLDAMELARAPETTQRMIFEKWNTYCDSIIYAIKRLHCDLKTAKFNTVDCVGCLNNTSSDNLLFDDLKLNTCMNSECFNKKQDEFVNTAVKIYKEEQTLKKEKPILFSHGYKKEYEGIGTSLSYAYEKVEEGTPGASKAMYIDGDTAGEPIFVVEKKETVRADDDYDKRIEARKEAVSRFYENIKSNVEKNIPSQEQLYEFLIDYVIKNFNWQARQGFENIEEEIFDNFNVNFVFALVLSLLNYQREPDHPFFEKYPFLRNAFSKSYKDFEKEVFEEKGLKID